MSKSVATRVVKYQRIKEVTALLVAGKPRWAIVEQLSQEWGCSDRNVDKYINAAKKLIQESFNEETIAEMNAQYNFLYQEALSGDKEMLPHLLAAKQVVDSRTKLKGIVERVEVTHKVFKTEWGNEGDNNQTI